MVGSLDFILNMMGCQWKILSKESMWFSFTGVAQDLGAASGLDKQKISGDGEVWVSSGKTNKSQLRE